MHLLDRINRTGTTSSWRPTTHDIVNDMRRRVVQLEDGLVVRDEQNATYNPLAEGDP